MGGLETCGVPVSKYAPRYCEVLLPVPSAKLLRYVEPNRVRARMAEWLVADSSVRDQPPGSTQLGHPSTGRCVPDFGRGVSAEDAGVENERVIVK